MTITSGIITSSRTISALSHLLSDGGAVLPKHTPFFQSGAGIVTVILLTAVAGAFFSFAFKWWPERWKENREANEKQRELLMDIKREVMPREGHRGIVDRVSTVEQNLANLTREVENILDDLREVLSRD